MRDPVRRDANLSLGGLYRYTLRRDWNEGVGRVAFVGLNPSTADATVDDPTIRRCIRFARDWGYGGLLMVNLFAWRATDPREMGQVDDPVGVGNDETLRHTTDWTTMIVAAWGAHPLAVARSTVVIPWLPNLHVLGLTKDGAPRHPLYMKASCEPIPWTSALDKEQGPG